MSVQITPYEANCFEDALASVGWAKARSAVPTPAGHARSHPWSRLSGAASVASRYGAITARS
jgi:hypothetical protein